MCSGSPCASCKLLRRRLVYEANDRMRDPVYGCVGAISFMQNQVSQLQMQLAVAQGEILCIQMQHRDGNENEKNLRDLGCTFSTSCGPSRSVAGQAERFGGLQFIMGRNHFWASIWPIGI
uniref:LOB domain-containing protein n=1 Tax=Oryza glumipatula TaxID=40148 RepID=A0A0D9YXB0_9ORYZ